MEIYRSGATPKRSPPARPGPHQPLAPAPTNPSPRPPPMVSPTRRGRSNDSADSSTPMAGPDLRPALHLIGRYVRFCWARRPGFGWGPGFGISRFPFSAMPEPGHRVPGHPDGRLRQEPRPLGHPPTGPNVVAVPALFQEEQLGAHHLIHSRPHRHPPTSNPPGTPPLHPPTLNAPPTPGRTTRSGPHHHRPPARARTTRTRRRARAHLRGLGFTSTILSMILSYIPGWRP
jgi:hypothetical protein